MPKLTKLEIELFECLFDEVKFSGKPSEKTFDLLVRFRDLLNDGIKLWLDNFDRSEI